MKHPPLVILGYSEAAMFLRRPRATDVRAILSIHGRREFPVEASAGHRLDLEFDDVEVPVEGDVESLTRMMARRRWAEINGLVEVAPTREDVSRIVRFAEQISGLDGTLLCHCGGGMSRAPAAALICLAVWRGAGAEAECVDEVWHLRRGAVPHAGMVRYADDVLGRGGNLLSALRGQRLP